MKTSATQFEMMINFMEEHGDISKPSKNPRGRIFNIKNWEILTNALNSDPTGEAKPTDKWKKVWSDLKNNTKKKAAKINRALAGTGGGPAMQVKLTDLEQRVLQLMGARAATGITGVVEAGLNMEQDDPDRTITLTPTPPIQRNSPEVFSEVAVEHSPIINIGQYGSLSQPGPSWQYMRAEIEAPSPSLLLQPTTQPDLNVNTCQTPVPIVPTPEVPAPQGHTPIRIRRGRSRRRVLGSPRQHMRPQTHMQQITENFLRSDEEWRTLLLKRMADEADMERERLNLRKLELLQQKKWQEIAANAVEVLNKISNSKLCRE